MAMTVNLTFIRRPLITGGIGILLFAISACSKSEEATQTKPGKAPYAAAPSQQPLEAAVLTAPKKVTQEAPISAQSSAEMLDFTDLSLPVKNIAFLLKKADGLSLEVIVQMLSSSELSPHQASAGATKLGTAINLAYDQNTDLIAYYRHAGEALEKLPFNLRDKVLLALSNSINRSVTDGMPLLKDMLSGNSISGFKSKTFGSLVYDNLVAGLVTEGRAAELLDTAMQGSNKERIGIISMGVRAWAVKKPNEASSYIDKMPKGPEKDQAITSLIEPVIQEGDLEAAALWTEQVADPDRQAYLRDLIIKKKATN